ncbi:MAG: hypothetical protein KBS78_07460 [Bacteroidales bacterium]|nr:hypothetical protein [Candidatus Cryptobacteroides faecihippi]
MEQLKLGQKVEVQDPTVRGEARKGIISGYANSMFDGQELYFVTFKNKHTNTYCREAITLK